MKVISFLGLGRYETTTYVWQDQEYATRFFPTAVVRFLRPESVFICATPEVQDHQHLRDLRRELEIAGTPIEVLPLPRGHSEAELWTIFEALTAAVHEGETVVFDITHSFRSLPILAFLAVAYLKVAKEVRVERVLYGAYEARDQVTNRTPVFDLTPFLGLLDWLTATDQFVQTGDARRLATLLNPNGVGEAARAASALSRVSLAALLCQPRTLMREARTLDAFLRKAETELRQIARPFSVLRERISTTFGKFATDARHTEDALRAQFHLVQWYAANRQLIQAMTLAREWLIDAVTWRLGEPVVYQDEARRMMEWAVSGVAKVGKRDKTLQRVFEVTDLNEWGLVIHSQWEERDELTRLWNVLRKVRNSLSHAEHQQDRMRLHRLKAKTNETIMPALLALAQRWKLAE